MPEQAKFKSERGPGCGGTVINEMVLMDHDQNHHKSLKTTKVQVMGCITRQKAKPINNRKESEGKW